MNFTKLILQRLWSHFLASMITRFLSITRVKLWFVPMFMIFSFVLTQELSASGGDTCCDCSCFNNVRKGLSVSLNAVSSALGIIADWQEKAGASSSVLKVANAATSGAAGILKFVNARFYDDYSYGKEGCHGQRFFHVTLSGLVITCNVASLVLSSLSVYSTSPSDIRAYNLASSLTNLGGMFFKSLDLWISPQPDTFKENYTRVPRVENRQESQKSSVEFGRVGPKIWIERRG